MNIGPIVRGAFGSHERLVSETYRSIFFNIDAFVAQMHRWRPSARKILEVGCGEGAMTERLVRAYPDAEITAIDITPRIGRLFSGNIDRVNFVQRTVEEVARVEAGEYDLVVLCDVLHHVSLAHRQKLLNAIRTTLAGNGALIFKDWEKSVTAIHLLGYISDRWISGDLVGYMTRIEMRKYLEISFGVTALTEEARISPWQNNIATLVLRKT
jgi:2-polyprenyl-3-methyl-5-hydroxy-6-metoxy-1,4-benzoquinol methylase